MVMTKRGSVSCVLIEGPRSDRVLASGQVNDRRIRTTLRNRFPKKEMGDDIISFDGLVEECVRDIYRQVSCERGVRASHAVCQYLAATPGHEIAQAIANATNPAVKQLLLNEQKLGTK
jgi:hypothetical protein